MTEALKYSRGLFKKGYIMLVVPSLKVIIVFRIFKHMKKKNYLIFVLQSERIETTWNGVQDWQYCWNIVEYTADKRFFVINFPALLKNINFMSIYMMGPQNATAYVGQRGKLIIISLGLKLIYQQSILICSFVKLLKWHNSVQHPQGW